MVPYTEHALVSRACRAIQHYLTTDEYFTPASEGRHST
jgi:hypothetical protein